MRTFFRKGVLLPVFFCTGAFVLSVYVFGFSSIFALKYDADASVGSALFGKSDATPKKPTLDKEAYDKKMLALARVATSSPWYQYYVTGTTTGTTTVQKKLWPVRAAYPNPGALLPFNRIVAYYGNFYSTKMGVLGEYPKDEMLQKLRDEVRRWEEADPETPVVPAINYIAITAQGSPGKDGKYRARMPDSQIDHALALAREVDGIVILDVQVGLSTLQQELPVYESYFSMPNVHLGIDPEFSMKSGAKPGTEIGSFSAQDVNFAAEYLATLVREHNLPPKVLVVHRFTEGMVTQAHLIRPLPEVQIIIDMDGWGPPAKKLGTYKIVTAEPVQFMGFKLFYKHDRKPPSRGMLTPKELLELTPQPSFIQYQ